jgi:rSAM/selenodomain-associated transferase 2
LKLSVIIPTLNESGRIGPLVKYLKNELSGMPHEIIISDGGSDDNTIPEAESSGAVVTVSESKGRACQMNHGAEHANGDIFYFLHADTKPPSDFYDQIANAIQGGAVAGCFRLKFDISHPLLQLYGWFTRFEADLFRFGDQSLFVKKEVFVQVNGFDETLSIMEDQEIVRSIKNRTRNFVILKDSVVTSARKYKVNGIVFTQLVFTLIVILYYYGARQEVLAHFYQSVFKPHPSLLSSEKDSVASSRI